MNTVQPTPKPPNPRPVTERFPDHAPVRTAVRKLTDIAKNLLVSKELASIAVAAVIEHLLKSSGVA